MLDAASFLLVTSSLVAVVISEKAAEKIVPIVFKRHMEELEQEERQLAEYYDAVTLAIIMNDKEAYDGLQAEMNEIYSRIFFRKIAINSSVFFIILSPYMLFAKYVFGGSSLPPITTVFAVAIFYFAAKFAYSIVTGLWNMRKAEVQ
ncbi:hypothetical protein [Archaeoglobus veneficus]|uniref:Uncharacterized protein n=1 Tax=Archaeoglobus veneficus (strain DSM 11195 / SNP6) TaxID=693661 RepID=F2KT17_ARCVS|nr:hypothetical protein [Archaeoglobus veneficus]AEA47047.1 hypothetical protein Arcve_1036 [Archaeoglobus veneficus SNP6]